MLTLCQSVKTFNPYSRKKSGIGIDVDVVAVIAGRSPSMVVVAAGFCSGIHIGKTILT